MKRLAVLFAAAAMTFSFCSCTEEPDPEALFREVTVTGIELYDIGSVLEL